MTLAGMKFTRLSGRVVATVRDGIEYRIKEGRDGVHVVMASNGATARCESLEDACDFITDRQEWE